MLNLFCGLWGLMVFLLFLLVFKYLKSWITKMNSEVLELKFRCNNELFRIDETFNKEDPDHLFKVTNDDDYTRRYIIDLINKGFISLTSPLQSIYRVNDDRSEDLIYGEIEEQDDDSFEVLPVQYNSETCQWTDGETRFLLNCYERDVSKVGPMKKFKTKKSLWNNIASEINKMFKLNRSGPQVENRYKTVLKRKKMAVNNNSQSGACRMNVPFEEELSKISALDDSIEPELLRSSWAGLKVLKTSTTDSPSTSVSPIVTRKNKRIIENEHIPRRKSVQDTLFEIHHQKEESKERRHREKMELLKELFQNNK